MNNLRKYKQISWGAIFWQINSIGKTEKVDPKRKLSEEQMYMAKVKRNQKNVGYDFERIKKDRDQKFAIALLPPHIAKRRQNKNST